MAIQSQRRISDKPVALSKVRVFTSTGRKESIELEADLRHMGCLKLVEKSWRVRYEEMMKELINWEVNQIYASTIQSRPNIWNAELWSSVYGFKQGGEGMATKKDDCTKDKFAQK